MSTALPSRQLILDRIRAATPDVAKSKYADIPRNYVHRGTLPRKAVLELMIERLSEYGAEVVESVPEKLSSVIAQRLQLSGRNLFLAPKGLPFDWYPNEFKWKIDNLLEASEIEQCEGVITTAFAGIADSGTIVSHHSYSEGRRVLTLLPDWHLCVLRATQVVETLPEYFARCQQQPPPFATYISGPSATADIEMTRIKGVHGPRFLYVILVRDEPPGEI